MTVHTLLEQLRPFVGKKIVGCFDQINSIATDMGYLVNVMDPDFNSGSIDEEPKRLNVRIDDNSVIKTFTIG